MEPLLQKSQTSKRQRRKQIPMHWIVFSIAFISIFVFLGATLLILKIQGITQGITTLTIISIVVGIIIGLLT